VLRGESAGLAAGTDDAIFTGSAAAIRNSCAGDRDAAVSKTVQAQMSFLIEVDIGLRREC
jgi:hypothetical protein